MESGGGSESSLSSTVCSLSFGGGEVCHLDGGLVSTEELKGIVMYIP